MQKFVRESWLVLLMGVVFSLLLAGTQRSLLGRIRENQVRELNEAIRQLVPGTETTELLRVEEHDVYKCLDETGKHVGWAVDASGMGFIDKIRLVAGLPPACDRFLGIKVIENVETPGLGNKIVEDRFAGQYRDIGATAEIKVVKGGADKTRGEIDAITGATWSSRYVTDIVNGIIKTIKPALLEQAE